jgi:hypothetical protein
MVTVSVDPTAEGYRLADMFNIQFAARMGSQQGLAPQEVEKGLF